MLFSVSGGVAAVRTSQFIFMVHGLNVVPYMFSGEPVAE